MIILIGHGYIGSAFAKELRKRCYHFSHFCHEELVGFENARRIFRTFRPDLVINCAAFIPRPSVSLCDQNPAETIKGNVLFPSSICDAAADQGAAFAHISTACLWSDGELHSEDDPPQRAFTGHCGFYVGTKMLAEEMVRRHPEHFIWRIRLPFDEYDDPRNYLRKLANFKEVYDHDNSLSHRGDFVRACLDLWDVRANYGTYNVVNPGSVKATDAIARLLDKGICHAPPKIIRFAQGDSKVSAKKLLAAGVEMRPVEEALDEALNNWRCS